MLYFRGQRIWKAIILDLLPKGLAKAEKVKTNWFRFGLVDTALLNLLVLNRSTGAQALLTGCSAGGLSTFLHCDNFTSYLPKTAYVKCMIDAGFFLDA